MHETSTFAALADPVRRQLLVSLAEHNSRTATELALEFPITRQGIRKHLTILQEAGLVAVYQEGRDKRYTVTPEPLKEVNQWLEQIGDKLDERLIRLKAFVEHENK